MPFRLGQIASEIKAELKGDPDLQISSLATIETAEPGDLSYVASRKFERLVEKARASALIVYPGLQSAEHSLLIVENPYLGFAMAMRMFYRAFSTVVPGVEKTAIISEDVEIPDDCYIGHNVVISKGLSIGNGVEIHAGAFIGEDVIIGDKCRIFQNATIRERVIIGANVVVYPNAVIGSDGFGYCWDGSSHVKIPQAGTVVIEDDVEIGAGTTIDRATLGETVIGRGTIIDNLVQIAHNCKIGPYSVICAQVGLAGSTELGRKVTLAGQVGLAGHLKIGDGAIIEAQSGVPANVPPGAVQFGTPSRDVYLAHKIEAILSRLPDYVKRIKKLESYFDKDG
jgi:UDP-3-O-[3-hydroxymyristoyl] glucosamine N-acyltransferase